MNLKALTSHELESVAQAIDDFHDAYDMVCLNCMTDDDDITTEELADAIVEEMKRRALEDAAVRVNQMVGRGEVDRYMRPDGQIGYGPALGANQDADWEL